MQHHQILLQFRTPLGMISLACVKITFSQIMMPLLYRHDVSIVYQKAMQKFLVPFKN